MNFSDMQSKQKVTLYIPPELHRKLRIKAALDTKSMSALVEKAITFYMQYPDRVEELESSSHGKTHQVHFCPECEEPLVIRQGELASLNSDDSFVSDEISLNITSQSEDSGESNEEELVSCL